MNAGAKQLPLLCIVDELYLLLDESANYHTLRDVREILQIAARTVQGIRRRLQIADRRYTVAVVGLTNVGKSTLLNALLGADVAPRRNGPCTAAPVEFAYGPEMRISAYFAHRFERRSWQVTTTDELHRQLALLAEDSQATGSQNVRRVVVELPVPLLDGDMVLADTPGFGAAQAGTQAGSHEESLRHYLRQDVSQVLWVVLADQGIGKREIAFHDSWFSQICDDVIVTGCEEWSESDRHRYRRRFAGQFGQRIPRFHFVSGLAGLHARRSGDPSALEAAGIPLLEARIRELANPIGRQAVLRKQLRQLAEDLSYWLGEYHDDLGRPLDEWWRPDSWWRWNEASANEPFGAELTSYLMCR